MRLIVAVGARPNVVKAAPLLPELQSAGIDVDVAFTGSREVARDEPSGPPSFYGVQMHAPTWYLDVGADTNSVRIGGALNAFEELFSRERPDAVLVIGDVNPTLAAAVASARAGIPVVHLGAGLRCGDPALPEEINRTLITRVAALHLAPTEDAVENLIAEGVNEERIHFVGNMMAESVLRHLDEAKRLDPATEFGLDRYALGSFHRPENLGETTRLARLLDSLAALDLSVVIPDIGGLREAIARFDLVTPANVRLLDIVPYRMMLALERDAACVITDAGGVQEEACTLSTPCVTVRRCTEHVATVVAGANRLAEPTPDALRAAVAEALADAPSWPAPPRWDKAVSDRIARVLKRGVPRLT